MIHSHQEGLVKKGKVYIFHGIIKSRGFKRPQKPSTQLNTGSAHKYAVVESKVEFKFIRKSSKILFFSHLENFKMTLKGLLDTNGIHFI